MLTIYTIVREFEGEFDRIQRNAIRSWLLLEFRPQVILFGLDEPGAQDAAREFGVPVQRVARNEQGTPLLRDAIEQAHTMADYGDPSTLSSAFESVYCYANADIVILQDFMFALARTMARFPRFLMSARRWDFDPEFTFTEAWDGEVLHQWVRRDGELHRPTGVDVFCYRGIDWGEIPDLAIGRCGWDNWLVSRALSQGVPFVNVTPVATIIHQNHPTRWADIEEKEDDPEYTRNLEMTRELTGTRHQFGFDVACWRLTERREFELTHFGRSRKWHKR